MHDGREKGPVQAGCLSGLSASSSFHAPSFVDDAFVAALAAITVFDPLRFWNVGIDWNCRGAAYGNSVNRHMRAGVGRFIAMSSLITSPKIVSDADH